VTGGRTKKSTEEKAGKVVNKRTSSRNDSEC